MTTRMLHLHSSPTVRVQFVYFDYKGNFKRIMTLTTEIYCFGVKMGSAKSIALSDLYIPPIDMQPTLLFWQLFQ